MGIPLLIGYAIDFVLPAFSFTLPIILLILLMVHVGFIVWYYKTKKFALFALPLSHFIFPILFLYAHSLYWEYQNMSYSADPAGVLGLFLVVVFYFTPIIVTTFIISLVIKVINWKRNRQFSIENETNSTMTT
jgi:hypothetical protein